MSAIWGKHHFNNSHPDDTIDITMRKPYEDKCRIDRITTLTHNNTYMGCGLQYITETSPDEVLPICDSDSKLVFTADCILDNRKELISQLSVSADTPDGSLILLSYKKWGIDCLKHFRGIYSFALYDPTADALFLATDQTSSRCLYYYKHEDEVYFSTLIEPITDSCTDIEHNQSYLFDYCLAPGLMPNITPFETPYKNVYKVCPGCYIKFTSDTVTEVSYWEPQTDSTPTVLSSAAEYGKAFRALFEECVSNASKTFKKTGISLSSGLDSSSIASVAATQFRKMNKQLMAYTYVPFEKNITDCHKNFVLDETDDIQKIIDIHTNIIPHFLNNNGKNCLAGINNILSTMEIPYKAIVNLPNLCEIYDNAYKDGCGIVLTGQCGNSTISYGNIEDILYDHFLNHRYFSFVSTLLKYAKNSNQSRKNSLKGSFTYFKKVRKFYKDNVFCYKPTNPFVINAYPDNYMFKERFTNNLVTTGEALPVAQELYKKHLYNKTMYSYLGELDTKLGLAYGIVIRDPSRDSRIISFCHNMPYKYFAYDGLPRWLIRGNFGDVLPHSLLYNLSRYGLQNSDWLIRIDRDWNELYPKIKKVLEDSDTDLPINTGKVNEYLQQCSESPYNAPQNDLQDLLFLYNIILFKNGVDKNF